MGRTPMRFVNTYLESSVEEIAEKQAGELLAPRLWRTDRVGRRLQRAAQERGDRQAAILPLCGGRTVIEGLTQVVTRRLDGYAPGSGGVLVSPDETLLLILGRAPEVWSLPDAVRLWREETPIGDKVWFTQDSRWVWGDGIDNASMTDLYSYETLVDARTGQTAWYTDDRSAVAPRAKPEFRLARPPPPHVRTTSNGRVIRDRGRVARVPRRYEHFALAPQADWVIGVAATAFTVWAWTVPPEP